MQKLIRGKAKIIKSKMDYYSLKDETILIAKNTTPDLVVIINKIKVIVTEINNELCHAAIVAREFNKPFLIGISDATKRFKTGDQVIIDLDNKTINKAK